MSTLRALPTQNTRTNEHSNQTGQENTRRVPTHDECHCALVAVKRVQSGGHAARQTSRTEAPQSLPRGRKSAKGRKRRDKNGNRKCRNDPWTSQCSLSQPQASSFT